MTPKDAPDLSAIRARLEKATPGPWEIRRDMCNEVDAVIMRPDDGFGWLDIASFEAFGGNVESNAEFIAHAHTDISALLAALELAHHAIRRLIKERDALQAARGDV